jgi:hypothetical protein
MLTAEHEKMKAEMALNRTKELEALKLDLESTIAEKTEALARMAASHEKLTEEHKELEQKFGIFVIARETEVTALLAEKAKLEVDNTHLQQSCHDLALNIVETASKFALKDDRRIRDDETHDFYQFEIDSRDEKLVWCISNMSSALVQAYNHVQNLERDVSIFPHKLNLAELKCTRLMEGQAHATANMARKDTELAAMSLRLKGFLHEVESYSMKYNLLEKKCAELEEEATVNKKLFEVAVMELEA